MGYEIHALEAGGGWLGIAPMPGRGGTYRADFAEILRWGADLVLTMTTAGEMAENLGADLEVAGIAWRHLPVGDFGAPSETVRALWPDASREAQEILSGGGKVMAHCYGGCGRSGMAVLRLMVEAGEAPLPALERLRAVRRCAVETEDQFRWAAGL
jgi:hypothetical protein